jgi:hypothetical protein
MRRFMTDGTHFGTVARAAIPGRRPRGGIEGAGIDESAPDSPTLEADNAGAGYEPSFQESPTGTALFDDGDLASDDGSPPLVA